MLKKQFGCKTDPKNCPNWKFDVENESGNVINKITGVRVEEIREAMMEKGKQTRL